MMVIRGDYQGIAKAVATLGVSAVLSLFLVYWLTQVHGEQMNRVEALLIQHEQNRQRDMLFMVAYEYALCLNTARDEVGIARCAILADGTRTPKTHEP